MRDREKGSHPPFADLADLADGRVARAAASSLAAHAASCGPCGETARWLGDARSLLAAGAASEPTRAALRRAFRVPLAAKVLATAEAVRTFVARLVFDSLAEAPQPALALRGGAPRHLVYVAGRFELEISRTEGEVRGSLVPREEGAAGPAAGSVSLLRGRRPATSAALDARGRFVLRDVRPGRYAILVEAEGEAIRVPAVDL